MYICTNLCVISICINVHFSITCITCTYMSKLLFSKDFGDKMCEVQKYIGYMNEYIWIRKYLFFLDINTECNIPWV